MLKYILLLLVAALFTYLIHPIYFTIPLNGYDAILQALLNISSIIFAIIGAWIAIIYPKAIAQTFGIKEIRTKAFQDDANYLSELVEIVLVSAFVLMFVLCTQFLTPIVREIPKLKEYSSLLKSGFFFAISFMSFIQLFAIFRVIIANYVFLNKLRSKNNKDAIDKLHD